MREEFEADEIEGSQLGRPEPDLVLVTVEVGIARESDMGRHEMSAGGEPRQHTAGQCEATEDRQQARAA